MKQRTASPWLTGFLVLVVIGLVLGALWMSRPDPPTQMAPEPAPAPVHVRVVETTNRNHLVHIYGQTRAWKSTTVAIDQSGLVTWRAPQLEVGQKVPPGLPLLKLDVERAELAVQAASAALDGSNQAVQLRSAELTSARLELDNATLAEPVAKREWERQKAMAASGAGPESAADQAHLAWLATSGRLLQAQQAVATAEVAVAMARNQVLGAEVAVRQAQVERERCELVAPIGGEITAAMVEVGQWMAPGMPVCEIVDRSSLLVEAQLPNADRISNWDQIKVEVVFPAILDPLGMSLRIAAEFHGLAPVANPQSRARLLQLRFDNNDYQLAAGTFAEVFVDQGPRPAIWLQPSEFRVGDHGPEVIVVVDDKAEVRRLRLGRALIDADGNSWHPVLEGLGDGDRIAIDNLETPKHGDPLLVL